MRCGNQNKMDKTKTDDARKHIPWRYKKSSKWKRDWIGSEKAFNKSIYCTSVYEHHYKIVYIKIAISLLFQLFEYWAVHSTVFGNSKFVVPSYPVNKYIISVFGFKFLTSFLKDGIEEIESLSRYNNHLLFIYFKSIRTLSDDLNFLKFCSWSAKFCFWKKKCENFTDDRPRITDEK